MLALSTATFLSACATDSAVRLEEAARQTAQADQVSDALEATRPLPDQPPDCWEQERTGVQEGDRLDVATLQGDQALDRANSRVLRCAEWYEALRRARGGNH